MWTKKWSKLLKDMPEKLSFEIMEKQEKWEKKNEYKIGKIKKTKERKYNSCKGFSSSFL